MTLKRRSIYSLNEENTYERSWVEGMCAVPNSAHDLDLPVVLRYQNVEADMINSRTWTIPQFRDDNGYYMCLHVSPNGLKQAAGFLCPYKFSCQPVSTITICLGHMMQS